MIKTILIYTCTVLILGCVEKTSPKQSVEHKQTLIYKNNILNSECESFLTKNIADYLVCDSWKNKPSDLNDIFRFSEKYAKNFVATHNLMEPTEIRLKKIIIKDSNAFALYPNGFFIKFKNKKDYENWFKGYSEVNQSYVCLRAECEKYFLWKFADEAIIAKNPNFERENPRADDIAKRLEEKYLNAQPNFIFKNNEVDINGKACHYKDSENVDSKCLYLIVGDILYTYSKNNSSAPYLLYQYELKEEPKK